MGSSMKNEWNMKDWKGVKRNKADHKLHQRKQYRDEDKRRASNIMNKDDEWQKQDEFKHREPQTN